MNEYMTFILNDKPKVQGLGLTLSNTNVLKKKTQSP